MVNSTQSHLVPRCDLCGGAVCCSSSAGRVSIVRQPLQSRLSTAHSSANMGGRTWCCLRRSWTYRNTLRSFRRALSSATGSPRLPSTCACRDSTSGPFKLNSVRSTRHLTSERSGGAEAAESRCSSTPCWEDCARARQDVMRGLNPAGLSLLPTTRLVLQVTAECVGSESLTGGRCPSTRIQARADIRRARVNDPAGRAPELVFRPQPV